MPHLACVKVTVEILERALTQFKGSSVWAQQLGRVAVFEGFSSHHAALSKKYNFSNRMFVYIVISLFPHRVCITKLQKLHKTTGTGNRNVGDGLQISLSLLFAVDVGIEPF